MRQYLSKSLPLDYLDLPSKKPQPLSRVGVCSGTEKMLASTLTLLTLTLYS